jgi:hypothetical protein
MLIIAVLLIVITFQAHRHYAMRPALPAQMQEGR